MTSIPRLFTCALCNTLTTICLSCDRGNIYCGKVCSSTSRTASLFKAAKRYRVTHKCRVKVAARQKKYREKQANKNKVTHQGSAQLKNPSLSITPEKANMPVQDKNKLLTHCCICLNPVSQFFRQSFLNHRLKRKTVSASKLAQAP